MTDSAARRAIELMRPIIDLDRELEDVDLRQPRAAAARMQRKLEETFQNAATEVIREGSGFAQLAKDGFRPEMKQLVLDGIRELGERVSADPAGEQLLRLLEAADAKRPGVGFAAFAYLQNWKPFEWSTPPALLLDEARTQSPEQCALTVKRALNEIAEPAYDRYVRVLWALVAAVDGGSPNPPGAFGAVVDQIVPRLRDYPNLVEPSAAFLRNAAGHNNYEAQADGSVLIWNDPPRERREVWSLADLHAVASRMLGVSLHLARDSHTYFINKRVFIESGVVDVLYDELPRVLGLPDAERGAALVGVLERLVPLFVATGVAPA